MDVITVSRTSQTPTGHMEQTTSQVQAAEVYFAIKWDMKYMW